MRMEAVTVSFPDTVLTIKDTLKMIEAESLNYYRGNLNEALEMIEAMLVFSGARRRRWLTDEDKPIHHIEDAIRRVFEKTNTGPEAIDMLIYTGLGRGVIEPGQAYMVAQSLGMIHAECFDILDACMSWTRALHIADAYLKTGAYKKILVVNGEFVNVRGGALYPDNYRLMSFDQIEWTFPNFTVGSAATATLLSADESNPWEWHFTSRTDHAELCTIPYARYRDFSYGTDRLGRNGLNRFTSFGNDLHEQAKEELIRIFHQLTVPMDQVKRIFVHSSSKRAWTNYADSVGVNDKVHHIFQDHGNLVSASVPAAMALAEQEGAIKKGDTIIGWVGSAGMSFSSYSFRF